MNKYFHRIIIFALLALISCNKIAYLPNVTDEVAVTADSATITFEVDRGDEGYIPQIEYATDSKFISSKTVEACAVDGYFEAVLDSLKRNTTYYYRFIVSNSAGGGIIVDNGESFTTVSLVLASVNTSEVFDIAWDGTSFTAVGVGEVTDEGGSEVEERGVCWGTERNPTIDDNYANEGTGMGVYTIRLTNLMESTVYYVRAYAVNSVGVSYGNEISFTTGIYWPQGILPGLFSVSESVQVKFSQGNLQFQASTNTWRFAENQYDRIGNKNSDISSLYSGWIDLFGWGTSGFDHGAVCYQPWSTSTNYVDYKPYGQNGFGLSNGSGQADWGYNAISNGGNAMNQWFTLSADEWMYVLFYRWTVSGIRYVKAKVNQVEGIILFPDAWDESCYPLNNINDGGGYNANVIDLSQWLILEKYGAVFLPVTGGRRGTSYGDEGRGSYWSTSPHFNDMAYGMTFTDGSGPMQSNFGRDRGISVRLVRMNME